MDAVPASVTQALPLRLIDSTGGGLWLTAELRYDATDPYAVDAVFQTGEPRGVRWVFARDLLAGGLEGARGDGDVRVWPHVGEGGHSTVFIELRSPDGMALLQVRANQLADFLASTYAIVPAGRESDQLDVDTMIAGLLDGTDPTIA